MEQNEKTFLEPTDDMLEEVDAENEEKDEEIKYPQIKRADMVKSGAAMSGMDYDVVAHILQVYHKAIHDLLISEVEVPIPGVGYITFQNIKPKPRGVRYNPVIKEHIESLPKEGFKRLKIKQSAQFKQDIFYATRYGDDATIYEQAEWTNKIYGEKSKFWGMSKEELDVLERNRQMKIKAGGKHE